MAPYRIISLVEQRSIVTSNIPSIEAARYELFLEHVFGDPGAYIVDKDGNRLLTGPSQGH